MQFGTAYSIASRYLYSMNGETKERWEVLCEQAAGEQNPAKLLELITEINQIFDEKQKYLNRTASLQESTHRGTAIVDSSEWRKF